MQSPRLLLLSYLISFSSSSFQSLVLASPEPNGPPPATVFDLPKAAIPKTSSTTPTAEPLGQSSRLTSLVFSEIMYHPAARADGKKLEFIELFNSLGTPEDLTGYRLSGDVDYSFPSGTVIAGGGFLVVARSPADLQSVYGLSGVLGPFHLTNNLPNDNGTIRLRSPAGAVFLEVQYGNQPPWPVAADGAGHSLVLARPSFGENDPKAWAASDAVGGSPGQPDPVTQSPLRSIVINEFLAHTDDPEQDFVELYNHSNQTVDLSGSVLTDDATTNKFVIAQNTTIAPRGFVSFVQSQLHFALNAAGETIYLKDPILTRVLDAVRFGGQENGVAMGRNPDGGDQWYRLRTTTPGAPNAAIRSSDVVINELMYAPISGNPDDQYVELYNQGSAAVDLGGWRLEDGVEFTFPGNSIIPADGFMVVARNSARLLSNYPSLSNANTAGNFSGKLAGSGERIALTKPDTIVSTNDLGALKTNVIHIAVDEVTYGTGGRWGEWSHGGGSSLERIDPRADGRRAANWADSDETQKAPWTSVRFTGRLDNGISPANQLQVLLQGAGECLIDDVQVLNAQGASQIANSSFERDASGWVAEGTEDQSGWESAEGYQSAHSYHLRAVDRGDNEVNRVRTALSSTLAANSTATIQAQARWLKGQPGVLFRLRGCWLEAVGELNPPANLGTPGARNSRAVPNAPPAIFNVGHAPVLPAASQPVVITAQCSDPDGLSSVVLSYRVDPSATYVTVPMRDDGTGGDAVAGDGIYSATVPGQSQGALVAFVVQATDQAASPASATFPTDAPIRECLVRFGESVPTGTFPVYRLWMTQATFSTWSKRNKMNNTPLDVTFVLGSDRVMYNTLALYAGSPYIAPGYNTPSGTRCGYSITFPADDRFLGNSDLVLDWPGGHGNENTALQEQMGYWIANKMGLPYSHRYAIRLHVNGVTDMQRGGVFEAVNQPAGDFVRAWSPDQPTGDFYKVERAFEFSDAGSLIADPEPRLVNYTTLGGVKKTSFYRWNWLKRSTDNVNDYRNIFDLVDAVNATSPEPYTSQTEALVDIEEWMGILATEHIIVNFDAYGHEIGKNMYAFKPDSGKWQLYMFDLDWLMLAAVIYRGDYAPSTAPLFNADDPLMVRMFNHPPFLRAYYRAIKRAVEGPLLSANCNPVMDAKYQSLVANGVTLCDGQALANPSAVKAWFSQRHDALAAQLHTLDASFAITSNNGSDFSTNTSAIVLTGTAPIEVKEIRVNGVDYPTTWTSVTSWSIQLILPSGRTVFNLQGVDAADNLLPNDTASTSVTFNGTPLSPVGYVVINEIMANPTVPGAEFIELFNNSGDTSFDLSGWKLKGVDFTFANGTVLGPGAYAVITKDRGAFDSAYGNSIPLAGEFAGTLNPNGEPLTLVIPDPTPDQDTVVNSVDFGPSPPWPTPAPGASWQLIDPTQDNSRVANWSAPTSSTSSNAPPQWQYVTATGTASTSRLYIYMSSAGDVSVDDLKLVAGGTPDAGVNLVPDGDFEAGFPGPWIVSANLAASSFDTSVKHAGSASLHVVSSAAGTTQSSAIWQDIGPLTTNAPYTLSYWYLPSTNGDDLTIRLSGSGIVSTRNVAPVQTPVLIPTPGAVNSVRASLPLLPRVWINEIEPGNLSGLVDNAGEHDPWLELYNSSNDALSLSGFYLTDDYANLAKWSFPSGATVGPKQFLIVWLDGQTDQASASALHSNFRAAPGTGSIALSLLVNGQPAVLDFLNYNFLGADRSYGLFPDGQAGTDQVFYSPTPGTANDNSPAPFPLWINEWMAANTSTLRDPADGHFDDWFELYNPNPVAVDLTGYSLADNLTNSAPRWPIPGGTTIAGHGYLLVWADNEPAQNTGAGADLHASFKLNRAGEAIALFGPNGQVVDSVAYGSQTNNVSQGRWPDGSPSIYFMPNPTPRASNLVESGTGDISILNVSVDVNTLTFTWQAQAGLTYRVQFKDDLSAPGWTDLADLTATGPTASQSSSMASSPHRFYRVQLLSNP